MRDKERVVTSTRDKDERRWRWWVRSAATEGMPNEADISRGSDHFHRGEGGENRGEKRWPDVDGGNEPREIVIQRGGTLVEAKFEFKAGRSGGAIRGPKRRRINLRVPG